MDVIGGSGMGEQQQVREARRLDRDESSASSSDSVSLRLQLSGSFILSAVTWLFFQFTPVFHNPDASSYYGMALRLSKLDLVGAGHLMHSPLLSILMVPWIWVGMSIPASFRIVNSLVTGAIFFTSVSLGNYLRLPRMATVAASLISCFQLIPFALFLITPDLLVVVLTFGVIVLIERLDRSPSPITASLLGAAIGCSYLAKAFDLPILLFYLAWRMRHCRTLPRAILTRNIALFVVGLGAIAAPWIYLISSKAGKLVISGQQWVLSGDFDLDYYHPDLTPEQLRSAFSNDQPVLSLVTNSAQVISQGLQNIFAHLLIIIDQMSSLLVHPILIVAVVAQIMVILWSAKGQVSYSISFCRALGVYCVIRVAFYLLCGGPFLRFYFPIFPLINLMACVRGHALIAARKHRSHSGILQPFPVPVRYMVTGLIITTALLHPFCTLVDLTGRSEDPFVGQALSLNLVSSSTGPLVGNIEQPLTGYVAYLLGRESWGFVTAKDRERDGVVPKLNRWRVEQLLWSGPVPDSIRRSPELVVLEQVGQSPEQVTLFKVEKPKNQ